MRPAARLFCVGCVLGWTGTMYRSIIILAVSAISITAAPQEAKSSEITYVKINPVTDDIVPRSLESFRESRIENLPLTIGSIEREGRLDRLSYPPENVGTKTNDSSVESDEKIEDDVTYNDDKKDIPRKVRSEDTTDSIETETVEPTETVTEGLEDPTQATEKYEAKTRAPTPRFLSKLSYFQKNDKVRSSIATNLVEKTGKKRFRSNCRCEKIWNCPKLQITVPRCPNEYFLCCF